MSRVFAHFVRILWTFNIVLRFHGNQLKPNLQLNCRQETGSVQEVLAASVPLHKLTMSYQHLESPPQIVNRYQNCNPCTTCDTVHCVVNGYITCNPWQTGDPLHDLEISHWSAMTCQHLPGSNCWLLCMGTSIAPWCCITINAALLRHIHDDIF